MSSQNKPAQSYRLELELRIDQKVVATALVEDMDLIDVRTELWWVAFANHGRLDADRLDFEHELQPIFHANARASSAGACDGFVLTCIGADGGRHEVRCTVHALKRAAERKAQELLDNKIFTADTSYVYALVARPDIARATSLRSAEAQKVSVSRLRATPLTWDVVPHAALLENAGFMVTVSARGDDAERMVRSGSFDMLLTELSMPRVSGLDILGTALQSNPGVVGIVMTDSPSVESSVAATRAGAWDYLPKPFHKEELLIRLEKLVQT